MKVKICGITSVEDAVMTCDLGADYIGGIINVPVETPRKITIEKAREIQHAVETKGGKYVAVIMPTTICDVEEVILNTYPDMIQLHGKETPELMEKIKREFTTEIIKAYHIDEDVDFEYIKSTSQYADYILLDTKKGNEIGGSGSQHNYEIDLKIKEIIDKPIILAGGLNTENVKDAIEKVKPYAIDASSKLEKTPGIKDKTLVGKFIEVAKCS